MKSGEKLSFLAASEWDFRQIDDSVLSYATTWEYVRSSKRLHDLTVEWLETAINGKTVRYYLERGLRILEKDKQGGRVMPPDCFPLFEIAPKGLWRLRANPELFRILTSIRSDFPASWSSKKKNFRILTSEGRIFSIVPHHELLEGILDNAKDMGLKSAIKDFFVENASQFSLTIFWKDQNGNPVKTEYLISEFAKWVRREVKKHPRNRGQRAQAQTYPLKCLSAYRFNRAGFTYQQAQQYLREFNDGGRLVPVYSDPSGWSDALRYARNELRRLASIRT